MLIIPRSHEQAHGRNVTVRESLMRGTRPIHVATRIKRAGVAHSRCNE
jgi:hypothetical protein